MNQQSAEGTPWPALLAHPYTARRNPEGIVVGLAEDLSCLCTGKGNLQEKTDAGQRGNHRSLAVQVAPAFGSEP